MFRTDLSGLTFFQREAGYERLSAYRFHNTDPLVFNGGGKLLWWVGQCKPFEDDSPADGNSTATNAAAGLTKCGNPMPAKPSGGESLAAEKDGLHSSVGRKLTAINVTTCKSAAPFIRGAMIANRALSSTVVSDGWYYTF